MKHESTGVLSERIEQLKYLVRKLRIMLDADLAGIYCVFTKALNQAVKRNAEGFAENLLFPLIANELADIRSQISSTGNQSQFVTGSPIPGGVPERPDDPRVEREDGPR